MPAFNLAPIEDDSAFDPVVPTEPTAGGGSSTPGQAKPQGRKPTRGEMNSRLENNLGPLKPLVS